MKFQKTSRLPHWHVTGLKGLEGKNRPNSQTANSAWTQKVSIRITKEVAWKICQLTHLRPWLTHDSGMGCEWTYESSIVWWCRIYIQCIIIIIWFQSYVNVQTPATVVKPPMRTCETTILVDLRKQTNNMKWNCKWAAVDDGLCDGQSLVEIAKRIDLPLLSWLHLSFQSTLN